MTEKHLMLLQHIVNHCDAMERQIKERNYGIVLERVQSFRMVAIEHLDKEGCEMHGCIIRKKQSDDDINPAPGITIGTKAVYKNESDII